jgi:hypothetical protein
MPISNKLSGVEFQRPEFRELLPIYETINDCLAGEHAIKRRRQKYLPMPNADDTSKENLSRYNAYLQRAIFFNVTAKTHGGAVGFMFMREPVVKLPPELEAMEDDATGEGVPLCQAAKEAVASLVAKGRAGVWADYPATGGATTVADVDDGVHPVIRIYKAEDIVNWRHEKINNEWVCTLVVLREEVDVSIDNQFETHRQIQYRVLELTNGVYYVSVWKKPVQIYGAINQPVGTVGQIASGVYSVTEGPVAPTDAQGKPFDEIPFEFMGIWKNVAKPDQPPLYDMAVLNLGHYRNSADYEESAFIVGQPTPWASGLTQDWVENVLKGKIAIGARGILPLPVNGQAGLLQASPNTMPKEAMDAKEAQMRALGAKLVATDPQSPDKTATEASINNVAETSVLSNVANNVSCGFERALKWCAMFTGSAVTEDTLQFKVHSDLGLSQMTAQDRAQLIAEWQAGALTWQEMRNAYHQAGIATEDDEKAKEDIANDKAKEMQSMAVNSIAPIIPGSENDPAANQLPPNDKNKPGGPNGN